MIRLTITRFITLTVIIAGLTCCNTSKETEKTKTNEQQNQTDQEASENMPSDNLNEEPVQNASKARSILIGKWEWEKTICCGRKTEVIKPEDNDKTQHLEFKKDSTVLFYKGGNVEKRKTYEVKGGTLVNNIPEINIEDQQPGILRITEDQLVLDYSYIDLQTEYYRKVE